jgi:hypothetical protein
MGGGDGNESVCDQPRASYSNSRTGGRSATGEAMIGSQTFPPNFPAGRPPTDAEPARGVVFRIVTADPPLEDDFLSAAELGRQPPAKLTRSQACRRHALSVYRSIDDARHHVALFPGTGRFIAEGTLSAEHGVTKDTPSSTRPSHVDWWCYHGIDRRHGFAVIEGQ